MTFLADIVILFAGMAFSWWFNQHFTFWGLSVNCVFAFVFAVSLIAGPVKSVIFAFILGLYADLLGAGHFGAYGLIYTLAAYLLNIVKVRFDFSGPFQQATAAFVLAYICPFLFWIIHFLFFNSSFRPLNFFIEPFLDAVAAPLAFAVLKRYKEISGGL